MNEALIGVYPALETVNSIRGRNPIGHQILRYQRRGISLAGSGPQVRQDTSIMISHESSSPAVAGIDGVVGSINGRAWLVGVGG